MPKHSKPFLTTPTKNSSQAPKHSSSTSFYPFSLPQLILSMENQEAFHKFINKQTCPSICPSMQQSYCAKLADSLPTNSSSLASLCPNSSPLSHHYPMIEESKQAARERTERALQWLKEHGVAAGDPEELFSQHRHEQKKNIILKLGRPEVKGRRGLPSLITRRLKSKASQESN